MRRANTKEARMASRYIPKDSVKIERPGGVAYIYGTFSVIAYRGTAGHAEFHTTYKTEERRQANIDAWFNGIAEREQRKAGWKAERKAKLQDFKAGRTNGEFSLTETAILIRRTLWAIFPATKFAVHSKSYTGGCSINVSWTDGPTGGQVKPILDRFHGCDFDGMQDLKTYRDAYEWNGQRVKFHADFVFGQRTESAALLAKVADRVCYETGAPTMQFNQYGSFEHSGLQVPFAWHAHWLPEGKAYLTVADMEVDEHLLAHDSHNGEYLDRLIYSIAANVSCEQAVGSPALPQYITEEYIDATVRRMLEEVA